MWTDKINQVWQGDCLELMKEMPDKCVDLSVTSPPYDNLRDYNGFTFNFEDTANELFRITKDGGVIVWIVADATINGSETGTSFKQALYFKEIGFNLHDTMIWNKKSFTAVGALVSRYAPVFEYMFILSKGKLKSFNPLKDRKNTSVGTKYHGTIRGKDGKTKKMSTNGNIIKEFGFRFNVWEVNPEKSNKNREHPAVFPLSLVKDHIISWSNENDLIFDPFMGSWTTARACMDLGRNFIGAELSPEYCEIGKNRLKQQVLI